MSGAVGNRCRHCNVAVKMSRLRSYKLETPHKDTTDTTIRHIPPNTPVLALREAIDVADTLSGCPKETNSSQLERSVTKTLSKTDHICAPDARHIKRVRVGDALHCGVRCGLLEQAAMQRLGLEKNKHNNITD